MCGRLRISDELGFCGASQVDSLCIEEVDPVFSDGKRTPIAIKPVIHVSYFGCSVASHQVGFETIRPGWRRTLDDSVSETLSGL